MKPQFQMSNYHSFRTFDQCSESIFIYVRSDEPPYLLRLLYYIVVASSDVVLCTNHIFTTNSLYQTLLAFKFIFFETQQNMTKGRRKTARYKACSFANNITGNFCIWIKSWSVTIQMKATEQYFPTVLFVMPYKVVPTCETVDDGNLDHPNKSHQETSPSLEATDYNILGAICLQVFRFGEIFNFYKGNTEPLKKPPHSRPVTSEIAGESMYKK